MNGHKKGTAFFLGQGWSVGRYTGKHLSTESIIEAWEIEDVIPALHEIELSVQKGCTAFGFISYEASAAFGLPVRIPSHPILPYVWFGLIENPANQIQEIDTFSFEETQSIPLQAKMSLQTAPEAYNANIQTIKQHIARGETYQVNYTVRAEGQPALHGLPLFMRLYQTQPVPYAVFLQTSDWEIHSLSPELFLQKSGSALTSRPMKGTLGRGRTLEEDRNQAALLQASEKDRAENVMILDMTRNDLGRLCKSGSVQTQSICEIERYRSLFQMTSTVQGELSAGTSLTEIMEAAFPAASITGAPKHRTMDIIRDLEDTPRGVYCGSIGLIEPNGDFRFNVAIRTLFGKKNTLTLGVGGGIVWDSKPEQELSEVHTKMAFLQSSIPDFSLIETLLLGEDGTYKYLDEHLKRLFESAQYWDIPAGQSAIRKALEQYAAELENTPAAVRFTLNQQGQTGITHRPVTQPPFIVKTRFSSTRVNPDDRFLYHKTTNRSLYNQEREAGLKDGFFETLFINEKGHVTEGTITSLFYRTGQNWYTPPLYDGLLPGVWRGSFMQIHCAEERSITPGALIKADEILIGNSVFGYVTVNELVL